MGVHLIGVHLLQACTEQACVSGMCLRGFQIFPSELVGSMIVLPVRAWRFRHELFKLSNRSSKTCVMFGKGRG
jgi:hypothetical protein